jgi:hypothetical protein
MRGKLEDVARGHSDGADDDEDVLGGDDGLFAYIGPDFSVDHFGDARPS